MSIRQTGPDHYTCSFPDAVNFFLFQVNGAAGRTIQFTFTGIPSDHWSAIRPVVGYGTDLSDPAFFEPDANGQSKWQFMKDCHVDDPKNITYTWHFTQNSAYVALRVPYTLEYQQRYLASLPKQKGLEIITIGQSAEGRPLTLIKIGRGDEQAEKENPCILMYAREHCDEPDSSWAVQGALRFLISNTPEAQQMRQKFTFLLIPMLDPDGWAAGLHENIIRSFRAPEISLDATCYEVWLNRWFRVGNSLAISLDIHNAAPGANWNLMLAVTGSTHIGGCPAPTSAAVIRKFFDLRGINISHARTSGTQASMPARLAGWLCEFHHVPFALYEVNTQSLTNRMSTTTLENTIGSGLPVLTCALVAAKPSSIALRKPQ